MAKKDKEVVELTVEQMDLIYSALTEIRVQATGLWKKSSKMKSSHLGTEFAKYDRELEALQSKFLHE